MAAVIQKGGILDEQIFSRLSAGLPRPLQVRCQDPFEGDAPLPEETIGGLQLGPVWKSLRQGPARTGGQMFGDVYQALVAPLIAQLRKAKFSLRPLGGSRQVRTHKLAGLRTVGQLVRTLQPLMTD